MRRQRPATLQLVLVDNAGIGQGRSVLGTGAGARIASLAERVDVLDSQGNVGYGQGHNLALAIALAPYHLILNPDVELAHDALSTALAFLDAHPEAGLLAPYVANRAGQQEFLCRRYPTLLDLAARGFLPRRGGRLFDKRLSRYEMRSEMSEGRPVWDAPIVSGCFMLFRSSVLKRLNGFDPRYFLYFEDYDLSLRTGRIARIVYVPAVRIVHFGGGAADKGFQHIRLFAASAWRFFGTHGRRLW